MHIFISYSRKDSEFVNHLHSRLTNANFLCLLDKGNKTAESALTDADKKNIKDSFALIVVMTENSQTFDWVKKEVAYARECGVPIVPILRSGAVWDDMKALHPVAMGQADALPETLVRVLKRKQWQRGLLQNKKLWWGIAAGIIVVSVVAAGVLLWPKDSDDKSNDDGGTRISEVASAIKTATTITQTPSNTPNSEEVVLTAAATILTATAFVDAVGAQVVLLQTQNAATNAYFEAGTASAQPTATETPTSTPTLAVPEDGSRQGEVTMTWSPTSNARVSATPSAIPSTTPSATPSATATASQTPDWYATAGTQVSANLTATVQAIPLTATRTPPRMTRTPTPIASPTATASPRPAENQPPTVTSTPVPSWTPSSTITLTPTPSATLMTPSPTPTSATASPTATQSPSPTAATMPPTEAMFVEATPGIANNPSHVFITVYAGPSYDADIVSFLYHTQAISIMGEVPGWIFIGYGWVRFDRVFAVGDESIIPIFQTQVYAMTPAAFSNEDIRALGYHAMTMTADGSGGSGGSSDATEDFNGPTLNSRMYQTFVAGETLTAVPTFTSTPTRTPPPPTSTPTRTPTHPPASNTPTRTATRTHTPLPPPSNTPTHTPPPSITPLPSNTPIPPPPNTPRPPTFTFTPLPFAISITSVNPQGYGSHPSGVGCFANITVSVTEDIYGEIWVTNANWTQGPESYYQFFAAGTNPYTATLGGDDSARDHTIKIITPKGQTEVGGVRCN